MSNQRKTHLIKLVNENFSSQIWEAIIMPPLSILRENINTNLENCSYQGVTIEILCTEFFKYKDKNQTESKKYNNTDFM